MDKAGIANRLSKAGLRNAAEAYREEVRKRILASQGEKRNRDKASQGAWAEMWDVFRPLVERFEKGQADDEARRAAEREPAEPPKLAGLPADTDSLLDPEYSEADPGKQLRDGLLWTVMEWMRIIRDTEAGPVVDLAAASIPPPNAWALFILSTYALSPIEKRRDLISRALTFAVKGHDAAMVPDSDAPTAQDGFLDAIS